MSLLRSILLAEDHPHDIELTLAALDEHHLAHRVIVVVKQLGLFWAVVNEQPSGAAPAAADSAP